MRFRLRLFLAHFLLPFVTSVLVMLFGGVSLANAATDEFSTPGNFTWKAPSGVTEVTVEVWGGGGAGGDGDGGVGDGGSGAGGGGYAKGVYSVVPGNDYSIKVGAGGSGTTVGPYGPCSRVMGGYLGRPGGTSSFSTLISATGGDGGWSGGCPMVGGGAGGIGSGGTVLNLQGEAGITQNGADGGNGWCIGSGVTGGANGGRGGNGGSGGIGGTISCTEPTIAPTPGSPPGGGGAGGTGVYGYDMGSAGGNGKVVISYTFLVDPLYTVITSPECGGKIKLSWTKVDNAAGYIIYRSDKNYAESTADSYVSIKIYDVNTLTYTDTTPKTDTRYWYYVFAATAADLATNSSGTLNTASVILASGPARGYTSSNLFGGGDEDSAVSSSACPLLPPTNLSVSCTVQATGPVWDFAWTPSVGATSYTLKVHDVGISYNVVSSANPVLFSTNTLGDASFYFSVGANNASGSSEYSSPPVFGHCTHPDLPDLTAGAVSPTSATIGQSLNFTTTVRNNASTFNAGVKFQFPNLFQRADTLVNGVGQNIQVISVNLTSPLPANNSRPVTSSAYSFPPSDAGKTRYVRACADTDERGPSDTGANGNIPESIELNNCGLWTPVTVGGSGGSAPDLIASAPTIP